MDLKLTGKIALVTGSSRGIGLATAKAFAAEGCQVMLSGCSTEQLREAETALRATGAQVAANAEKARRGDAMLTPPGAHMSAPLFIVKPHALASSTKGAQKRAEANRVIRRRPLDVCQPQEPTLQENPLLDRADFVALRTLPASLVRRSIAWRDILSILLAS